MTVTARPADGFDGVPYTCHGCREGRAVTTFTFDSRRSGTRLIDLDLCDQCVTALRGLLCPAIDPTQIGGGKVGRTHPETSRRAASTVRAGSQQAALLDLVAAAGTDGATCAEVASRLSIAVGHTISRNQTATRMLELRERGFVTAAMHGIGNLDPVTRSTGGGNEAQVWIATADGRAEAVRLRCRT